MVIPNKGVSHVGVYALIGNGGKEPIKAPSVKVWLFDADDRKYAPIQQGGRYRSGVDLNPLLTLEQEWVFQMAAGVSMHHVQFILPSGNIIQIDLTKETHEHQALIASAEGVAKQKQFERY